MSKRALIIVILVLAAAGLTSAVYFAKPKRIDIAPELPPLRDHPLAPLVRDSVVTVPVAIPYATVRSLLERAVPNSFNQEISLPDSSHTFRREVPFAPDISVTVLLSQQALRPDLTRGNIGLANDGGRLHAAFDLSGTIRWNGHARLRRGIGGGIGIQETLTIQNARPSIAVAPSLNPDWSPVVEATAALNARDAYVEVLGARIGVATLLNEKVSPNITSALQAAADRALRDLPLRPRVEEAWSALGKPVGLPAGGSLHLNPTAVAWSGLQHQGDVLTAIVAIACRPTVRFGDAETPAPKPLPPLETRALEPGFRVAIPVIVAEDAINSQTRMEELPITVDSTAVGTIELRVSRATVLLRGGKTYLLADFAATSSSPRHRTAGQLLFQATPVLSPDGKTLSFTGAEFDAATTSELTVKAVEWLAEDAICRKIEGLVRLDIGAMVEKARREANTALAKLAEGVPGVQIAAELDRVAVPAVQVGNQQLFLIIEASGTASVLAK